ncbi:M14 family metallopeptidase [Mesorhizobium calcicola]|uniref:M14 family metallopeptidase n=1 Tax=Mesorhizobium calcicola TaxID=1300310 RepID=A0ABW4WAM1_9HYPH
MSNVKAFFSAHYQEARHKFREAAIRVGAKPLQYRHCGFGPNGEELTTDVALVGDIALPNLVIVTAGLHGVEGFCGSGCLIGILEQRLLAERNGDTAVLLVHALSPHGFAYLRRVDECNVDLNRNFIDHAKPLPRNDEYRKLHDLVVPQCWEGPSRETAEVAIRSYVEQNGHQAFISALTKGQYEFPDGMFFGGLSPAFSNMLWRRLLKLYDSQHERICVIDVHSGLGPRGYGEIQFEGRSSDLESMQAQAWYRNEVTVPDNGSSSSAALTGYSAVAVAETLPRAERICVTLEFGTQELEQVLCALRGDHWLHAKAPNDELLRREIKQGIRNAYYCDDGVWKLDVVGRAAEVFISSLRGIGGRPSRNV